MIPAAKRLLYALAAAAPLLAGGASPSAAEETLIVSPMQESNPPIISSASPTDPAALSDAIIAKRVQDVFLAQRTAAAADAEIHVRAGIVTLSGKTVTEEHKRLATVYARAVDGVVFVDNQMTVVGTEVCVKSTAVDKMDDAAVTVRVKAALYMDRPAGAIKIAVRTRDGVVALSGRARSAGEKAMIGKLVSELGGVAAVDNRMTIAP
ncbi:MAG: BON domain-containing protein [Elusimicrobiota bacterium]